MEQEHSEQGTYIARGLRNFLAGLAIASLVACSSSSPDPDPGDEDLGQDEEPDTGTPDGGGDDPGDGTDSGGGNGDGDPDPSDGGEGDPDTAATYAAAAAAFADDTSALVGLPETGAAAMPSIGSATYAGSAAMSLELSEDVFTGAYATMTLEADFADGTVAGALTNFVEQQAGAISGAIDMETGTIAGAELAAEATGQITLPSNTVDLTLDLTGTFRGDTASAIEGTLIGSTLVDGDFEGTASGLFSIAQ